MTHDAIKFYKKMALIRRVEERLASIYHLEEIRCPMHLCIGQEAVATGVCSALEQPDQVFSNHRSHGHYIAKGGSLNSLFAELFGKSEGCCGGRGGSMHLVDTGVNFMASTPIVGGTVPVGMGAAWASKLSSKDNVVTVFFGDGCFEEGVVHECMNFAKLYELPLIFVCENNHYSVYTHISRRQPNRPIHLIAAAHGWESFKGNGNSVFEVFDLAKAARDRIVEGRGPQFLELETYRVREHCGPDYDNNLGYRTANEIKDGQSNCPIDEVVRFIRRNNQNAEEALQVIDNEIDLLVESALSFARRCQSPKKWTSYDD